MAISERAARPNLAPITSRGSGLLVTDPACPATVQEAYKQAFLNIRFALLGAAGNTLLVSAVDDTSLAPALAANVAILAAQEGERVVLVDGNLHAPSLDGLFSLQPRPGFSTLIRHDGTDTLAALQSTDVPTLRVLGAGDEGGIPGGLGRARGLGEVMMRLKNDAERVVVIGAPILSSVDSMDLCPLVDGVVLTVTPGATHREDARSARRILERVHGPLLGVVLTQQNV